MSFNTGLSGLRAASTDLSTAGNNISNASTTGFKSSRAEFSDVYANSVYGSGRNSTGSGVQVSNITQQFTQGNLNYTSRSLDLAINGNGFFITSNNGLTQYTRAGMFGTDREGYIVDTFGYRLQGYTANAAGQVQNGVVGDLRIDTASQEPRATTEVQTTLNLDASAPIVPAGAIDSTDPRTYSTATSVTVYDSIGNAHVLSQYFAHRGNGAWDVQFVIDGDTANAINRSMGFTTSGAVDPAVVTAPDTIGGLFTDIIYNPVGAAPLDIQLDMRPATQYAASFAVNRVVQDGYTTGQLAGVEIADTGEVFARYTNGQSRIQGQVVLANFANPQGLTPQGKTSWAQSVDSGEALVGVPRSGTLGALTGGALEDSNVELSDELVRLIIAQRNFQANAKTIETANAITQTVINLR